jgi:hypothetical protein
MMPSPVLRLVNPDGSYGRVLPDWTSVTVGGDAGEHLVLQVSYRTDAPTWELLQHGATVAVLLTGTEVPGGRFVLDDSADEEVIDADTGTWQGNSLLFTLNYAIVYPASDPDPDTLDPVNTTTPGHGFAGDTPGKALRILLEQAQARGWWPELAWDFTDAVDSAGATWDTTIDDWYDQGTTLLDLVIRWKTRQLAVATMAGNTLQLYRYDGQGTDRSLDVVLMRGVDLTEGPVNRSTRNTVSVMLGVTDGLEAGGFGVERTDNPALSTYGRREGFVSQSQIPDDSTLAGIVDGTLALKARSREAFTYGLVCGHPDRLPFLHWDRGDLVSLRVRGTERQMRVRQLSVTWDQNGTATGSAGFGDRKTDLEEQLAQRLERLTGGSMDAGVFGQPLVGAPDQSPGGEGGTGPLVPNAMPPGPPTGLSASSQVVFEQGYLSATATITWVAPTVNADDTPLDDLGGFEVQYRHTGYPLWENGGRYAKDATAAVVRRLVVGQAYDYRVRAFDTWGNVSDWASSTFTADNDIIAPAQTPSTPVVSPFLYAGLLIHWDGMAAGGTAIDNDLRHVEVHVSTSSGFAPSAGTYKDKIDTGGGDTVIGELTPGTTYYVKFRSVDWAGNLGPSSAQTTGVPDAVQTGDIGDGAVTDTKIASLSATKITAGTITAVITQSGTIQTAASGARVVQNSAGIKLFDAAGNVTVALNSADGTATFNGVLGSANITGYVRVVSGVSQCILQNVGTTPTLTLTTGRTIEKVPGYIYVGNDAFFRTLWTSVQAPGSQYAGGGANYDYTYHNIVTSVYDGDFANATVLPTKITGWHVLGMPLSAAGSISPRVVIQTNYTSLTGGNDFHRYTAVVLKDGTSAQHEAAIRLDELTAGTQEACRLAVVKKSGGVEGAAWAEIAASAFTVSSGRAVKTDVTLIPYSALRVVRDNPALRWRYISEDRFDLGPMADDLPEELVSVIPADQGMPGVEEHQVRQHSMIGLLWRAVEELADQLDEVKGRVA